MNLQIAALIIRIFNIDIIIIYYVPYVYLYQYTFVFIQLQRLLIYSKHNLIDNSHLMLINVCAVVQTIFYLIFLNLKSIIIIFN